MLLNFGGASGGGNWTNEFLRISGQKLVLSAFQFWEHFRRFSMKNLIRTKCVHPNVFIWTTKVWSLSCVYTFCPSEIIHQTPSNLSEMHAEPIFVQKFDYFFCPFASFTLNQLENACWIAQAFLILKQ